MKDGRTHLAHKAEHAVDVETGALVAVTLQDADQGDTTTIIETAIAAADQIEDAQAEVGMLSMDAYSSGQTACFLPGTENQTLPNLASRTGDPHIAQPGPIGAAH